MSDALAPAEGPPPGLAASRQAEPTAAASAKASGGWLWVVLVGALALRMAVAWQPVERLVTHVMPDDAFYYLQIARHIAAGHNVTFDGTELTNGFHPLWMVLVSPLFLVARDNGPLGVHLSLTLAALLDVATVLVLARTVAWATGRAGAGVVAAAWYAFNPAVLTQVANGLETSLNLLCLAGLFALAIRGRGSDSLRARWWVAFGCVAGLAMLARSDNVVPVVIIGVGLCVAPWRRQRLPGLLLAALVSAVCVLPWLWWNWRTFGRILQTSAGAYSLVTRGNLLAEGYGAGTVAWYAVRDTFVLCVRTIPLDLVGESKVIGVIVGILIALLALGCGVRVRASARRFVLPALACAGLLLVNSLLRGTLKVWYVAPVALIVAYGVGMVGHVLAEGGGTLRARRWAGALLILTVGTGFVLNGSTLARRGLYPWQTEMLAAGRWLQTRATDETTAGSFNSGIIAYMSGRTVVNLDGLVNTSAADAVAARRVGAYIDERGIQLLVDNRYTLFDDYRRFYGEGWTPDARLDLVEEFALPGGAWAGQHVGAYQVRRAR